MDSKKKKKKKKVLWMNEDIIVSPVDVELGENFAIFELIYEVGYKGKWVSVLGGVRVKIAIILTGSKGPILFGHEEEWECLSRLEFNDLTIFEVFFNEGLAELSLGGVEQVGFSSSRDEGVLWLYSMVKWT